MKILALSILFFSLLSSCAALYPVEDTTVRSVQIHGTIHKPYCGGAKPSPDVAAGYYESMTGIKYNIFSATEFSPDLPVFKEFTFDENGIINLSLAPGNYVFMRADKQLPLADFIKLNGELPNENYKLKDNACFAAWKNTVDIHLTVKNDTIIEFRQKAKCWVGTNSCMEYVGPPAP